MMQLTFDDLIYSNEFSDNQLINDLVAELDNKVEALRDSLPDIRKVEKDYSIWEHVPRFGERLSYSIHFDCEFINSPKKYCGVGVYQLFKLFNFEEMTTRYKSLDINLAAAPQILFISTIERSK